MTEWDHDGHHGHDGPDDPAVEPSWDVLGTEPAAPLGEPSDPDDPYGSPPEPGSDPDGPTSAEPAGLPEEQPADWSGGQPDHPDHPGDPAGGAADRAGPSGWDPARSADPGSWEKPGGAGHDPFGLPDQDDLFDGTDPAGWTDAGADPFPPTLDVKVQPGDGGPWVDPDLLGGPDYWTADQPAPDLAAPVDPPSALLPDLAAADGDPDAGWDALRDSDDPAVRALTRHWNP